MNRAHTVEATSPFVIGGWQYGLSAAVILPAAFLLSMTFPLMTAGFLRRAARTLGEAGQAIAKLYFVNSLGAVFGVPCSTFVLVPWLVLAHAGWRGCSR